MKDPLIPFSELLKASTASVSFTETATLEFCYDHLTEDFSEAQQGQPLLSRQIDFSLLGIQGTE